MPYWIDATLQTTPHVWLMLALGVVWALALLPRRDWRDLPLVACVAIVAGAALLTVWLFVLGVIGGRSQTATMTREAIWAGMAALTLLGAGLALWRFVRARYDTSAPPRVIAPFSVLEVCVIVCLMIALVIRWLGTAYWPAMTYDELWVYGYQGKLYGYLRYIPEHIGYYPPFLALQYAYLNIVSTLPNAMENSTIARTVLPYLHLGSILAAYVLGVRLVNRSTGIMMAGLWGLYHHVGLWSRFGDLEIPLTMSFTLAAAFFLMAWTAEAGQPRRQYAALAGLALGVALWTKPSGGALVWGVVLVVTLVGAWAVLRQRADAPTMWARLRAFVSGERFQVAWIMALCCLPMGMIWYLRNALLGLPVLVLPPSFWLTQAARSGVEFGWPLVALCVFLAYVYWGRGGAPKPDAWLCGTGLLLVLLGLMPTIITQVRMGVWEWLVLAAAMQVRMGVWEWLALAAGAALIAWALWRWARAVPITDGVVERVVWAWCLALPFFVTWFYSYSYHYRLSFPIVPLMMLPTAVILARWFAQMQRHSVRVLTALGVAALSVAGIVAPLYDPTAGWDWLWTDKYIDSFYRQQTGNPALMRVASALWIYQSEGGVPRVIAPNAERLPYFFVMQEIHIQQYPTRLAALQGFTHYVFSIEAERGYADVPALQNQVLGSLKRTDIMQQWTQGYDGNFYYDTYQLHLERRWVAPQPQHSVDDAQISSFARVVGYDLVGDIQPNGELELTLYWQAVTTTPNDYSITVQLRDAQGDIVGAWTQMIAPHSADGKDYYYSTVFWEQGEYITDVRAFNLPATLPAGRYQLTVQMHSGDGRPLPTMQANTSGTAIILGDITVP
jgi:hypothetical protein